MHAGQWIQLLHATVGNIWRDELLARLTNTVGPKVSSRREVCAFVSRVMPQIWITHSKWFLWRECNAQLSSESLHRAEIRTTGVIEVFLWLFCASFQVLTYEVLHLWKEPVLLLLLESRSRSCTSTFTSLFSHKYLSSYLSAECMHYLWMSPKINFFCATIMLSLSLNIIFCQFSLLFCNPLFMFSCLRPVLYNLVMWHCSKTCAQLTSCTPVQITVK